MSFNSKVSCPVCGTPIHFDSQMLLAGTKFSCANSECTTSISLTSDDKPRVSNAFEKFESLAHQYHEHAKSFSAE